MPLVINFPINFSWQKQTPPITVGTVETERYLFDFLEHDSFSLNAGQASETFGSMAIHDDIIGPLQRTDEAMCCHYSTARGIRAFLLAR